MFWQLVVAFVASFSIDSGRYGAYVSPVTVEGTEYTPGGGYIPPRAS